MDAVVLDPSQSKHGAVETRDEAKRCAELFRAQGGKIDGVIVTLPNFGDERAIADTLRLANLDVPVLVQATPDTPEKMTIAHRRDSFCGKMSACNNLRQYGIPYSLTKIAHGQSGFGRVSGGPRKVCRGMPGEERAEEPADRQYRRSSDGVQYCALQREDAGVARHLGGDA